MKFFRMLPISSYTKRQWKLMGALAIAFMVATYIASNVFVAPAVIQLAAGVALAFLVMEGVILWPAIIAGGTLAYLLLGANIQIAVALSVGHALHAVVGATLLRLFAFDPIFRRVRDMLAFMVSIFFASAVVPLFGYGALLLNQYFSDVPTIVGFADWWMGIFISDLILGALIIRWWGKPNFERSRLQWTEIIVACTFLSFISYILYWTNTEQFGSGLAILIYLIPFVWFVLRLGMRFTLLAFTLTATIGITGILYGYQPESEELGQRILTAEFFLATIAIIFYLFVAVVEERQRATRDLNAQLDRVKALLYKVRSEGRAKSDFLAIFSHELRNPLAPIVSSLELLKLRGVPDPETKKIVDVIDERTRVIVRLLDDLLDISRISRKTFKLKREVVELDTIIRQAIRSVSNLVASRSLTLHVTLLDKPVMIFADPVRIEQILINLLNNAAKYTDPGGEIRLQVTLSEKFARISIKDTGIGIHPDMLKRIFEPFLQLEKDPKQRVATEGLGIGLSLTEKLVVMHGGTIEAKSEGVNRGSEFVVCLPIAETDPVRVMAEATLQEPKEAAHPKRILVVDDNEAAGFVLGQLLETQGHTIEYATSGVEAIQKTVDSKPHAVILDIGLPDMDGYNVARILREDEEYNGTLIAVTGFGQEADKLRALSAGFDEHLTKPVNGSEISLALGKLSMRAG